MKRKGRQERGIHLMSWKKDLITICWTGNFDIFAVSIVYGVILQTLSFLSATCRIIFSFRRIQMNDVEKVFNNFPRVWQSLEFKGLIID